MTDIDCMINTQRILCLMKYIENYVGPWKMFLDPYLKRVGRQFVLKGQSDPIYIYKSFFPFSFIKMVLIHVTP